MKFKELDELIPHPTEVQQIAGRVILAAAIVIPTIGLVVAYPVVLWGIVPVATVLVLWASFRSSEC